MGGHRSIVDKAQEIPASQREPRAWIGRGVLHHHSGGSSATGSPSRAQGWGGSPLRYPARRGPRLGLCLTMATHYDHATNIDYESTCIDCRKIGGSP
jgi:hypothetical protein